MQLFIKDVFLVAVLGLAGIGFTACTPENEYPPAPPPPPPPTGTDYSKSGDHGKTGIEPYDAAGTSIDVETGSDRMEQGSLLGSSISNQEFWDTTQILKNCPENPIYVFDHTYKDTVPRCADGVGFTALCKNSEKNAWKRAVNVVRSCERVPSCRGRVGQTGQKWSCQKVYDLLGFDDNDEPILGNPSWSKDCWTQYKVTCFLQ